ncbi:hypothetical protein SRIMHP_02710 [Streptomyces rimosus subsp. rimosus]|uniref:Uncharacterized protein n=1 Tax=Streptomyces rimosus subsp. rimosus TaxID=132474 RepID=A0ABY3YXR8_STRRM|nr:hypothetical protein SRIMR7_02715 [Streptomyces rimosus subsp. rimosus]UTH93025.1 hypothetical protein SRIMHP_02710 [Streptomyces rimosus subsp. rimosus]UTJ11121.1 hypothetical protein SRIMDV3_02610 [Streptomyces rimosus subsp. rimosus]
MPQYSFRTATIVGTDRIPINKALSGVPVPWR